MATYANLADWGKDTAIRAVKTFAQTAAALFTAGQAGVVPANWKADLVASGLAAAYSILQNVQSIPGQSGDAVPNAAKVQADPSLSESHPQQVPTAPAP